MSTQRTSGGSPGVVPAGAATEAKQDVGNTSLASIAAGTPTSLGQKTAANSQSVVLASDQTPVVDSRLGPLSITVVDSGSTSTPGEKSGSIWTGTPTVGSVATFTNAGYSSFRIQISGTWVGTLSFEVSADSGSTYVGTSPLITGTSYRGSTITANAVVYGDCAGASQIRVRATAFSSGTASILLTFTDASGLVKVDNPISLVDNSSGVAVTVKPASTAALATDPSTVVALSPNSNSVKEADGANVTQGTTTDAAVITDATGTVIGFLRGLVKMFSSRTAKVDVAGAGASGSALTGNPVLFAGSDGTNARTIKTDTSGGVAHATSGPTTMQNAATATGNGTVLDVIGMSIAVVQATITNTATITFEGTIDGGVSWLAAQFSALNAVSGANNNLLGVSGQVVFNTLAFTQIRARISSYTSGSVTVTGIASSVSSPPQRQIVTGIAANAAASTGAPIPVAWVDASGNVATARGVATNGDGVATLATLGSLSATAIQYQFNGSSFDRTRTNKTFVNLATVSIAAETTIWTPTSGKKFRLMGFCITQGTLAGNVTLKDNTAGTTILVIPAAVVQTPLVVSFPNGILSAVANNVLTATGSATETISGFVYGTEE